MDSRLPPAKAITLLLPSGLVLPARLMMTRPWVKVLLVCATGSVPAPPRVTVPEVLKPSPTGAAAPLVLVIVPFRKVFPVPAMV